MAGITVARIEAIEECQKEHDAWINGNGKPGAKVQLKTLEDAQLALVKEVTEIKELLKECIKYAVGLIFTILASVLVYFLLNVIPHVAK